ncbi:UDP-glycosyltransferase 73C3-like [Malania oleifera]|uniref:UDP-glycosyltransferase 73C3-like n=1 Tax=Malania oleifera TaxID=397392 RepID=UPI0025AEA828|nr:UDP-glycosyltransferase 73C3-like [Malania oleifera]
MASTQPHEQLHFILIPLMSQSHLIPFTDMAKLLARHGPIVTLITTPLNAERFKTTTDRAKTSNLKIQLIPLRFPSQEAGLPLGCENLDALPSLDLFEQFLRATSMLQEPLENLLQQLQPRPSCIISDIVLPWTSHLALKFKIPRLLFHVISCFTLACSHNIRRFNVSDRVASNSEPFVVPEIPDRIEFTKAQLPKIMVQGHDASERLSKEMKEAEWTAEGVMVNSFEDLEPNYVKEYEKVVKKIWCVGPVSLCNEEASDKASRGSSSSGGSADAHRCLQWLASRDAGSVVYVCFGSQSEISTAQSIEIGLGLEAVNRPFVWIIRERNYTAEFEEWLAAEKYEERVKDRGLIIKGWAPQVLILTHPAVGGFVTHCGWNSTLEGLSAGLPMTTWPMSAEQFFNEKFIVQVLGVGVRIGVEVMAMHEEEEVLVKKEEVKRGVEELMGEGGEAVERRERARELGKMAKRAIEGGSSEINMVLLIQHILQLQASNIEKVVERIVHDEVGVQGEECC